MENIKGKPEGRLPVRQDSGTQHALDGVEGEVFGYPLKKSFVCFAPLCESRRSGIDCGYPR
jgi:hypothetical protein